MRILQTEGMLQTGELLQREPAVRRAFLHRPAVTVSVLGAAGSHTEHAARTLAERLGRRFSVQACPRADEIVTRVATGRSEWGVLPIHNSTSGPVRPSVEALSASGLHVLERLVLPVRHALLVARSGRRLSSLTRVISHPHALAQCRSYLRRHLPGRELVPCGDTATAARALARSLFDSNTAVLASERAAALYRLHILAPNCQGPDNRTTFVLLGRKPK